MKSLLMKIVFKINGGIKFHFVCWSNRVVREQCCYYFRVGWSHIILLLVLLKEMWTWGKERIAYLCRVTKRMRNRGAFKISLSNPMSG